MTVPYDSLIIADTPFFNEDDCFRLFIAGPVQWAGDGVKGRGPDIERSVVIIM